MTDETLNSRNDEEKNVTPKPDEETLHKTDPQDNMKGPVSSTMHKAAEGFETKKSKEEADKERDEHM